MKENTNYSKLETIFNYNGGYITRKDADKAGIPSWFLSDFARKNQLNKIAPGFYTSDSFIPDDYFIFQQRYPKYIYSGMSALYLHKLTDKIVTTIEVSAPQGYNPSRIKRCNLIVHKISNENIYKLGVTKVETMFGNEVNVYDEERTICDIIKHRDEYDGETFFKAVKLYIRNTNNQIKLFRYASVLGIEKKVFEVIEVMANEN